MTRNTRLNRFLFSLILGIPAYMVFHLIKGYAIENAFGYGYFHYTLAAILAFFILIELQHKKSQWLEHKLSWKRAFKSRVWVEVVTSFLLTLPVVSVAYYILYVLAWNMEVYWPSLMLYYCLVTFISLTMMTFVNTTYILDEWKVSIIRAEALEKENMKAKLMALQNQLSPHFLFNNFSILNGLIDQNPAEAKEFISRLSNVFRFIIESKHKEVVKIEEEIDFIKNYIFVLQTRFKEKLDVKIDAELLNHSFLIPPVTLQQLIENAVKHNETSYKNPLLIDIHLDHDYLAVSNVKMLRKSQVVSAKTGILNIQDRYRYLTDREVLVFDDDHFTVKLPLLTKSALYENLNSGR